MKFLNQLVALIIATSIQAQTSDAGDLVSSVESALSNALPTSQAQEPEPIASSVVDQNQPTGSPNDNQSQGAESVVSNEINKTQPTESPTTISGSISSSAASASSSSTSSNQNSGSQIAAPARHAYILTGALFALIGNWLI